MAIASGLTPRYKFLEYLAEHFGINSDFYVKWGGFRNCEIKVVEQVVKDGL